MPAAYRLGDPVSCGDTMAQGSGNVFVNELPFSRQGIDLTAGHCFPPVPISSASPDVYVNDIMANRVGDPIYPHCCGDSCHGGNAATGSPDVYVNDGAGGPASVVAIVEKNIQPGTNKLFAARVQADDEQAAPIDREYQRIQEQTAPVLPPQKIIETAPPPAIVAANVPADCSDIEAHQGSFPASFPLSTNYTLGSLTTQTVVSTYRSQANAGLTEKQIICNLRLLCFNILEPLFSKYGGDTIQLNSVFRARSGGSQHNEGKAADVWFKDLNTEQKRWDRAVDLKDTINYDQFIYEAQRSVWYHLSWNAGGYTTFASRTSLTNRHQTLTKPRGTGRFLPGIQRVID